MTRWKLLTHDYRPPVQGGDPVWDGTTLPFALPETAVDKSGNECGAGWNSVSDLAAGMRIAGLWPTGRPSAILVVEPTGTVVERGEKTRSSGLTIVRRATDDEIRAGLHDFSAPFGDHRDRMAESQWAWYQALGRPRHNPVAVEDHLRLALHARGLGWTLRRFDSAWDAWDVRAARDARAVRAARDAWAARAAWDAWAVRAVWDVWDARAAWAAWAARAAWDAWAVRDAWAAWAVWAVRAALAVEFAALVGWTQHDPLLLTTGLRDAYANGLGIAIPTGPGELGWVMEDAS